MIVVEGYPIKTDRHVLVLFLKCGKSFSRKASHSRSASSVQHRQRATGTLLLVLPVCVQTLHWRQHRCVSFPLQAVK